MFVVSAVFCQVEVTATGWSLVRGVLPTVVRRVWSGNVVNEKALGTVAPKTNCWYSEECDVYSCCVCSCSCMYLCIRCTFDNAYTYICATDGDQLSIHVAEGIYRVIHKSLRDFRSLQYSSRDSHAEGEHVNRGRLQVSVLRYRCSIAPFCCVLVEAPSSSEVPKGFMNYPA
jgi:hypothetical protein